MADLYPKQVQINEASIKRLTALLKGTYKDVVAEIETATDFGVKNRRRILAQIDEILTQSGEDVQAFLEKELPEYYKQGTSVAVKQLDNIGADVAVAKNLNQIHKNTIMALVDDAGSAFAESLTGVKRSARLLLGKVVRDQMTQNIGKGLTTGEGLQEIKKTIMMTLKEQGLSSLVDKGGKTWELDTYAEMLFRTKAVEARNRGLINRVAENDYDLVEVSDHNADCDLCSPYEGQILSVNGTTEGYETVAEAESNGLFHPNCRHAINVLIPSLANKTKAYDPNEDTVVIDQ